MTPPPSGKRHSCRFLRAALVAAILALGEAALSPLHAAVPEVSGVTMAQASDRLVTITYTLADAPAVITLDVQTNVTGDVWASIGGKAVWNATGDVWKKVESALGVKGVPDGREGACRKNRSQAAVLTGKKSV